VHTTRGTPLIWHKACPSNATCVEIAALPEGGAAIRDGKNPQGPVLLFGDEEWTAFLAAVKAGRFDARTSASAPGTAAD
jgi:hypothetical protein